MTDSDSKEANPGEPQHDLGGHNAAHSAVRTAQHASMAQPWAPFPAVRESMEGGNLREQQEYGYLQSRHCEKREKCPGVRGG